MKKLFFIIPLGLSLTTIACSSDNNQLTEETITEVSSAPQTEKIIKDVNVQVFSELIAAGEGEVLDVRTPEEWAEGSIKGATKMNFFDSDFNAQLEKLDKSKPIYVYCKAGGRSGKAAKQMNKMGFTTVYNLVGGITAWNSAEKETVK